MCGVLNNFCILRIETDDFKVCGLFVKFFTLALSDFQFSFFSSQSTSSSSQPVGLLSFHLSPSWPHIPFFIDFVTDYSAILGPKALFLREVSSGGHRRTPGFLVSGKIHEMPCRGFVLPLETAFSCDTIVRSFVTFSSQEMCVKMSSFKAVFATLQGK
jgi:hypothetical protein